MNACRIYGIIFCNSIFYLSWVCKTGQCYVHQGTHFFFSSLFSQCGLGAPRWQLETVFLLCQMPKLQSSFRWRKTDLRVSTQFALSPYYWQNNMKQGCFISIKATHPNYTSSSSLICNLNLSHSHQTRCNLFSLAVLSWPVGGGQFKLLLNHIYAP